METAPSVSLNPAPARRASDADLTRWLYAVAAVLLLVAMFLGFQQFYLHGKAAGGRPLAPPLVRLIIGHGASMTLWVVLLVVQSFLVVGRKVALHRTLGSVGAVFATLVFFLGFRLATESVRLAPPEVQVWGMSLRQFLAVPVVSITTFAALVAAGVYFRRQPEVHRPLMLAATLVAIPAAVDRYEPIVSLYRETALGRVFGPYCFAIGFALVFLGIHSVVRRRFDGPMAVCLAILTVTGAGTMALARSPMWDGIAGALLGQ